MCLLVLGRVGSLSFHATTEKKSQNRSLYNFQSSYQKARTSSIIMSNGSISDLDSTYGWVVHILLNRWQDCVRIEETVNEWKMQLLLVLLDILEENQRSHISNSVLQIM